MKQYEPSGASDKFAAGDVISSLGRMVNAADVVLCTRRTGIKVPLLVGSDQPGILTARAATASQEERDVFEFRVNFLMKKDH